MNKPRHRAAIKHAPPGPALPTLVGARRRRARRLPGRLALACLTLTSLAAAADTSWRIHDRLEVTEVELTLVVEDAKGAVVPGLLAADFELFVDGKAWEIAAVLPVVHAAEGATEETTAARADTPVTTASERFLPTSATPDDTSAAEEPADGLRLLVVIDELFTYPHHRSSMLRRLAADFTRLGPHDRVAVVAVDGSRDVAETTTTDSTAVDLGPGATLLAAWTAPGPQLDAVLVAARSRPAHGLRRRTEPDRFGSGCGGCQSLRSLRAAQLGQMVTGAQRAMVSLATLSPRQSLVLLSGGWPYEMPCGRCGSDAAATTPLAGGFEAPGRDRTALESGSPFADPLPALWRELAAAANHLGFRILAVDVPGFDAGDLLAGIDVSIMWSEVATFSVGPLGSEALAHETLRHLARETGGRALVNAQAGAPIRTLLDETAGTYVMTFRPPAGASHAMAVRVLPRDPRFRVRHRPTVGRSLGDLAKDETLAQLATAVAGGQRATAGYLRVALGKPKSHRLARIKVPIALQFPADGLGETRALAAQAQPAGDPWHANLELRVVAEDRYGRSEVVTQEIALTGPIPRPGQWVEWHGELVLRRSDQRLALTVLDPASGLLFAAHGGLEAP